MYSPRVILSLVFVLSSAVAFAPTYSAPWRYRLVAVQPVARLPQEQQWEIAEMDVF